MAVNTPAEREIEKWRDRETQAQAEGTSGTIWEVLQALAGNTLRRMRTRNTEQVTSYQQIVRGWHSAVEQNITSGAMRAAHREVSQNKQGQRVESVLIQDRHSPLSSGSVLNKKIPQPEI